MDIKWTPETIEAQVAPLLGQGWSIIEVSRSFGMSRQRLSKILKDNGYDMRGRKVGKEG